MNPQSTTSDPIPSATGAESAAAKWPVERYVPLAAWVVAVLVLLLICLKISAYGYLPGGDLRRHVAHPFADNTPWTNIVVMRPGYTADHSPGWEWLLKELHQQAGWDKDALVSFSIISLLLCIFIAPLPWLRRPEAWLLALLTVFLTRPSLLGNRLTQGRPFLLNEAILIAMLFAWSRPNTERPSWLKIILTTIGISLSVWMHSAWYLWAIPVAAYFLAGAWRSGLWLIVCSGAGTILGALYSGHPFGLLYTEVQMCYSIFHENIPQWMLQGEVAPDTGDMGTVAALVLIFLASRLPWRQKAGAPSGIWLRPVVVMMVMCWVLGFKVDRFWADWGIPAALVWMTVYYQEFLEGFQPAAVSKRLVAVALIAAPLYLAATNDTGRRYTANLDQPFLDANDPALKGWFPDHNGIFYSKEMDFFYDTFYTNPRGNWRYILGFESAEMPEEDQKIMRRIEWNGGAYDAYRPWIEKMRPEDRLVIFSNARPNLPQLEWLDAAQYIWIGRLPRAVTTSEPVSK